MREFTIPQRLRFSASQPEAEETRNHQRSAWGAELLDNQGYQPLFERKQAAYGNVCVLIPANADQTSFPATGPIALNVAVRLS
jgi:hypothetical protein